MAKPPALKPPSMQSIDLVIQNAYNCPQASCHAAQQTIAAINEVSAFFRELLQIKSQPVMPQAAATDAGKPSAQG